MIKQKSTVFNAQALEYACYDAGVGHANVGSAPAELPTWRQDAAYRAYTILQRAFRIITVCCRSMIVHTF